MFSDREEIEYLRKREAASLRMAADASEPHAAIIHRRMAEHYAETARAAEARLLNPVS